MATKEHIKTYINFNHNLNISFVNPSEIKEYEALGYQLMMHKKPDIYLLLALTPQEIAVLTLLVLGNQPKEIARLLDIKEDNVRQFLRSIREKLHCRSNYDLIVKIKDEGLDFYLLQNR